mmetsp:Transcript_45632/g.90537  ORF Transcript_45632/g.90537 Transcript_45632/m.90537 type:complete len:207 (+) Transcript_45632:510-1130(+)
MIVARSKSSLACAVFVSARTTFPRASFLASSTRVFHIPRFMAGVSSPIQCINTYFVRNRCLLEYSQSASESFRAGSFLNDNLSSPNNTLLSSSAQWISSIPPLPALYISNCSGSNKTQLSGPRSIITRFKASSVDKVHIGLLLRLLRRALAWGFSASDVCASTKISSSGNVSMGGRQNESLPSETARARGASDPLRFVSWTDLKYC